MQVDRRILDVLLVEDDPGDALLIREVFEQHGMDEHLTVVGDGVEAMDYLRGTGAYSTPGRPDLVLLDLNLPRRGGREVLAEIKGDAELARIPVVVLTTSSAEEDIIRSYADRANAYVTKPLDWDKFTSVVRTIGRFFSEVVRLPAKDGGPPA